MASPTGSTGSGDFSSKSFFRMSVEAGADYKPHELLVSDVISFTNDHKDKLGLLYFTEILQTAAFGMGAIKMRASVTEYWTREVEAEVVVVSKCVVTANTRISSLAAMLLDKRDVHVGEDVYSSFDKSINILAEAVEDPCQLGNL